MPFIETLQSLRPVFDSLRWLADRAPLNWPAVEDLNAVYEVMTDGIPLVFVPNRDLVYEVLTASSYEERVAILKASQSDVVRDCRAALSDHSLHAQVEALTPLALDALSCLELGQHRSAQALAVCICDGLLVRAFQTPDYERWKKHVKLADLDEAIMNRLYRFELSLMPIVPFLKSWNPLGRRAAPARLSRHVTIHGGTADHFSEGNALMAAMLAVSLLLGVSEWMEVSGSDAP